MDIQKKTPNQLKPADFVGSFRYKNNPEIELTTNVGLFLWKGRERTDAKSYIISTQSFLRRLRNVETAIRQDDPWADKAYYLLQIAIEEAEQAFLAKNDELQEILKEGHNRLKFPETVVNKTVSMEIQNHSRLGWKALEVLLLADDTARLVFEGLHRGRFGMREKTLLIKSIEQLYRGMMSQISHWKYIGVSRDDIAANNQKARDAKEALGEIETDFLTGDLRSKYAPDLPIRRQVVTDNQEEEVTDEEVAAELAVLKRAGEARAAKS